MGRFLPDKEVNYILMLLRDDRFTMTEIAEMDGCSLSTVSRLNALYDIREKGFKINKTGILRGKYL